MTTKDRVRPQRNTCRISSAELVQLAVRNGLVHSSKENYVNALTKSPQSAPLLGSGNRSLVE